LFKENNIAAALLGEVIGDATTDDAAADNDDAGLFGE
jgi:hypothetical protein